MTNSAAKHTPPRPDRDQARAQPPRRTLHAWTTVQTMLLACGAIAVSISVVYLLVTGDTATSPTAGANSYSASAIGYQGFVQWLRQHHIPVQISKHDSTVGASTGLLIIAEPPLHGQPARDRFLHLLGKQVRTLVILPKWQGQPDPRHPEWIASADKVPIASIAAVADAVGAASGLTRLPRDINISGNGERSPAGPAGTASRLTNALAAESAVIHHAPTFIAPAQLSEAFWPIVASDDGCLLAMRNDALVTVLTDPDVANNHGLDNGRNAAFMLALINALRDGGPVVISETLHGFAQTSSVARLFFQAPLATITLTILFAIAIVLWTTVGRFGPIRVAPSPQPAGNARLIANTAQLLRLAGHDAAIVRQYVTAVHTDVKRHLQHAQPCGAPLTALPLVELEQRRNVSLTYATLLNRADALTSTTTVQALIALARDAHQWRQEMLYGRH